MANEYLKRTPTSTGNRKVWTLALWLKRNAVFGDTGADAIFNAANTASNSHGTDIRFRKDNSSGNNNGWNFFDYNANSFNWVKYGDTERRDSGNWFHAMFVFDSTKPRGDDRVEVYINGVLDTAIMSSYDTNPSTNYETYVNSITEHYLGVDQFAGSLTTSYSKSQFSDVFLVDGQALTPDVFGFYKEGKGYESSGTSQATDFRPGQWSPHSPRTIKNAINRTGGFGVNGFYLPMNDSSNFGADFHCAPDSIIKLKGEDLPQPRNGAPETTDAYVSQLREDPYAANLVLAVPGISTSTGPELVTNGDFSNGTNGWTLGSATGTLSVVSGELFIEYASTNGAYCTQTITTEVGKSYKVSVTSRTTTANQPAKFSIGTASNTTDLTARIDNNDTSNKIQTASFVATSTTTYLTLGANYTSDAYFDNVSIREEAVPLDYSADIKGSGTNKTLTVNGGAGIADIPSYYGSAMVFDGAGDYLETTLSAFGTSEFTIEYWIAPNSISGSYVGTVRLQATTTAKRIEQAFQSSTLQIYTDTGAWRDTGFAPPTNQWTHIALEKYNGYLTLYANGVAVWTVTNTVDYDESFNVDIGSHVNSLNGYMQDVRVYSGVAKYKGGFDVPKPYTPVGIQSWRQVPDTCNGNNFATMNSLNKNSNQVLSAGNLNQAVSSTSWNTARGTIGISTGKYYWEVRSDGSAVTVMVGVDDNSYNIITNPSSAYVGFYVNSWSVYFSNGQKRNNTGSGTAYGSNFNSGDICMVALDATNGKIYWGKNGTWFDSGNPATETNPAYTNLTGYSNLMPAVSCYSTNDAVNINFGQNPTFSGNTTAGTYTDANGKGLFKYQPPSGFLALCEDNLPTPAIADPGKHFKTVLYTGDGTSGTTSIKGFGFKPDLIWLKGRSGIGNHGVWDSVRGVTKRLSPNLTDAESISNGVVSFDDDGFSRGTPFSASGSTYVAWGWKAGGNSNTFNVDGTGYATASAAGITDGSIPLTGASVNTSAGFSVVSYTSNGTSGATVGHHLNKTPSFILVKMRSSQAVGSANWAVYHKSLGATKNVWLDATNAENTSITYWNNTEPTSSVFSLGNDLDTNHTNGYDYIAYCWAEIEGFSKFGSFTGNGDADGPFIWCGFKPAWLMVKRTDSTSDWGMYDSSRNSTNPWDKYVVANEPGAEGTATFGDFLSNGFKWRYTGAMNQSGANYIFMAFAESPFQTANAK